jgi:hypothetical protein
VLRLLFSCLRNAPASDTWDLSSLLVNGSPVSQVTVEAVLLVLYSNLGAYETDSPASRYSLSQLLDMLLFADAVGCSKAVLTQLAGQLGSAVWPRLEIRLLHSSDGSGSSAPARKTVHLYLSSVYAVSREDGKDTSLLKRWRGSHSTTMYVLSAQASEQLQQQVCQQLEALLFVGFKLDLQQLLQPALRFLRASAEYLLPEATLLGSGAIFSQRLLAAAGGASVVALLARSCVQQPLGRGFGIGTLFSDTKFARAGMGDARDRVSFEGTLTRDLREYKQGSRLHVTFDSDGDVLLRDVNDDTGAGSEEEEEEGQHMQGTAFEFGVVLGPEYTFTG